MHEPKPRFLAPIGRAGELIDDERLGYVTKPELGVRGEPECIGPAILDGYAESNAFRFAQEHMAAVLAAQKTRPLLAADDRVRDIQRRAKYARVDLTHEVHLMRRDLDRAKAGNRKPPDRVLKRAEALEALLDGIAA